MQSQFIVLSQDACGFLCKLSQTTGELLQICISFVQMNFGTFPFIPPKAIEIRKYILLKENEAYF